MPQFFGVVMKTVYARSLYPCIVLHSFSEVSLFSYHRHLGGRPHRPGIPRLRVYFGFPSSYSKEFTPQDPDLLTLMFFPSLHPGPHCCCYKWMNEFAQQRDNSRLFYVRHGETGRGKTHSPCPERTGNKSSIIIHNIINSRHQGL